jgi:hypothetical protein
VLVVEHQHGSHASAVLLVSNQFSPAAVAHLHAPRPVVAVKNAILVLQQNGQMDIAFRELWSAVPGLTEGSWPTSPTIPSGSSWRASSCRLLALP